MKATEAVGKRAAKAAVNVGTGLASDMLLGKLNKRKAKDILNSEINELRTDANNFIENYKQNYVSQEGSGKRRRLSKKPKSKKSKKMPKRKSINKRTRGSKKVKRLQRKNCKATNRRSRKAKKSRRQRSIEDIFGK